MTENPYQSTIRADEAIEAADLAEPSTKRPRVWTVFVALVAALLATFVAQVAITIIIAALLIAGGTNPQDLPQQMQGFVVTPMGFIMLAATGQIVFGMTAYFAARWSPQPTLSRLGLVRPRVPLVALPVIMIGALFPLAIGVALAELIALAIPPDPSVAALYENMTSPMAVPFILFIALAPGFVEEMLFRGYVQTRLLQRWPAWVAILVTSTIFGIFHVTPHAIVFAFVLGLWLGVLAWRTGSIIPSIACHAFVNGAWNVWQVGNRLWGFPETPPVAAIVGGGVIVVACFGLSVWLVCRKADRIHEQPMVR